MGEANYSVSDVKAAVAAIRFIVSNAVKYDVEEGVLKHELQQLGLPKGTFHVPVSWPRVMAIVSACCTHIEWILISAKAHSGVAEHSEALGRPYREQRDNLRHTFNENSFRCEHRDVTGQLLH